MTLDPQFRPQPGVQPGLQPGLQPGHPGSQPRARSFHTVPAVRRLFAPASLGTSLRERARLLCLWGLPVAALLLVWPEPAHAASVFNGFPLVDDVLCGFFAYSRTKLAPMIAGVVLVFSVVGHWLGSGKMWSTMLYVGLGLGIVLGTGSALASYTGVAASCIAS